MASDARHGAGRAAHAARHARAAAAAARRGRNPGRGCGLRRLPHRFACGRRRAGRIRSCRSCRATRSSAASRRSGAGVSGFAHRRARRRAVAGRDLRGCPYCRAGAENLCDAPVFTGYTRDGGYATHAVADARFCFPLARGAATTPKSRRWLCAGLIGWRSYRMAGEGKTLGLYGFGAAAHILAQVAIWQGRRVFRLHPQGRHRGAGLRAFARRGLGRRLGRGAAGTARCRHHLRAGGRAGAGGAQGGEEGRPRGLRRHPHVGHPELSRIRCCGRSGT